VEDSDIGNWFAYVALFGWPIVCIALFVLLPLEAAAIGAMLGGYLLLPSNLTVDVPLLPPLDKMSIAALATFLLCWMKGAQSPGGRPPVLIYVFAFGLICTLRRRSHCVRLTEAPFIDSLRCRLPLIKVVFSYDWPAIVCCVFNLTSANAVVPAKIEIRVIANG
jgi:hypothetical protein